jgi:hypothetical protein
MMSLVRSVMRAGEFLHVEGEIALFAQVDGHSPAADVIDHRLVDREAGVGIDHLVAFVD